MTPPDQFPSIVTPGALATPTDTYIVPALIADLGDAANWRYVEFFTANINNDHTREPMRAPATGFTPGAKIQFSAVAHWAASQAACSASKSCW
jgi:hypothetical protein